VTGLLRVTFITVPAIPLGVLVPGERLGPGAVAGMIPAGAGLAVIAGLCPFFRGRRRRCRRRQRQSLKPLRRSARSK